MCFKTEAIAAIVRTFYYRNYTCFPHIRSLLQAPYFTKATYAILTLLIRYLYILIHLKIKNYGRCQSMGF